MRIATWNVNSLKVRLPRVEEWLAYAQPDVLCIEETKVADANFPSMAFSALGYESASCGQGQWNGVAILSRVGLDDVVAGFSDQAEDEAVEARLLWATCGACGWARSTCRTAGRWGASTTRRSSTGWPVCASTWSCRATRQSGW